MAERRAAQRAKTEAKNAAVRARLDPLAPDERPAAITISSVFAGLVAIAFAVNTGIALFTDTQVAGARQPSPLTLAIIAGLMTWLAIGLWQRVYGATLAFQAFLTLVLVAASLGLIQATRWIEAGIFLLVLAGSGYLFYKLIRVMARIQAPGGQQD